jgi:DNA repair exonuclease SbcCD ATPase subunit
MRKLFLTIGLVASLSVFAQTNNVRTDELQKDLQTVKTELKTLHSKTQRMESETASLKAQLKTANETIADLKQTIQSLEQSAQQNSKAIRETADRLGVKISTTEETANRQIRKVGSNSTLYIIIVFLLAIVLLGLVYLFLSKRQSKTKEEIEETLVKKFEDEVNALMQKIDEQPIIINDTQPEEIDHSFFLKTAGEINLMERNLILMDENTRGRKQLLRSIDALKDNLSAHGYKMIPLLGKQYNQGMKVIVINSILDENMETGDEIITKVIIPQVHYKGKMIQAAQIELTIGPEEDDDNPENNNENNNNNLNTIQS